ncbi:nucleotide exchange factor GrpE [Patulibacter minatonensis]|uniref:nucleotide exchange factor GrpE n=1 Tax=Patulibacter minatonensis TaxID=298163 RepID=UPI00068659A3|nr:nucleotide exchange factor GrpE [Patulibacter minatonensis]
MSDEQRDHQNPATPADGTAPGGAAPGGPDPAAPAGAGDPATGGDPAATDVVDGEVVDAAATDAGPAGSEEAQEQAAADADQASADAFEASAEVEAEPVVEEEPDWKDRYVRSVAELDNVRKRARRDAALGEARGIAKLAKALLPALDNLDRALAHVDQAQEQDPAHPAGDTQLVEGVRIVHREIHAALSQAGIEAYDPTGEPFDPHAHEALTQQPAPEGTPAGTILAVYQAGYRRGDDILRAAKVVVAG